MKKINMIGELNVGDIILSIPHKLFLNSNTDIILDGDNKCFVIQPKDCDIESFVEEVGIGKVIAKDVFHKKTFIENTITRDGLWINFDVEFSHKKKSFWVL